MPIARRVCQVRHEDRDPPASGVRGNHLSVVENSNGCGGNRASGRAPALGSQAGWSLKLCLPWGLTPGSAPLKNHLPENVLAMPSQVFGMRREMRVCGQKKLAPRADQPVGHVAGNLIVRD